MKTIYRMGMAMAVAGALHFGPAGQARAQTVGAIQEGQPWKLLYDHNGVLASAIYVNGIKATNFSISQITVTTNAVAPGSTNAAYTLTVNMPALERGQYRITATVMDPTIGESAPSEPLDLKAKPRAPWWLRLF